MKLIVLEGINGAGKTTQSFLLGEKLKEIINNPIYILCDPGITKNHEAFKKLKPLARFKQWKNPLTNMMIYMAARCELNAELEQIEKKYKDAIVILDRYILSFYAYGASAFQKSQGEINSEILAYRDISTILKLCNIRPVDFTVYLSISPELAMKRWMAVNGSMPDLYEQGGIKGLKDIDKRYRFLIDNSKNYYGLGPIIKTPYIDSVDISPEAILNYYLNDVLNFLNLKQETAVS